MSKENKNNGNANGAPRKLRHALAGLVAVGLFASPLAFAGSASATTAPSMKVSITPAATRPYLVGRDVALSAHLSDNSPASFQLSCAIATLHGTKSYSATSPTAFYAKARSVRFRIPSSTAGSFSCSVEAYAGTPSTLVSQTLPTFSFITVGTKKGTAKRPVTTTTVDRGKSATSVPTPGIQASIVNEKTQVTTTSATVRVGRKAVITWATVPAPGVVETYTTLLCATKSTKEETTANGKLTDVLDVTHKATPANPLGYLYDFSFTSRVPRTLDCLLFTGGSTTYFSNIVKVHFIK